MAEIRGHFVQKDGSFVWMDGPAVRAWKEGARLVINEIDHAGEDVQTFLFAIMDDPEFAVLNLPTGEEIRPQEGFQLIATMNGEPDDLPDALQDRLPVAIEIAELNPEALDRLPEDLRAPAKNTSLLDNPARKISVRAWLEFASLREKIEGDHALDLAAQAIFGNKADQALLALNIAEEASVAFTIEDPPANVKEYFKKLFKEVDGWIAGMGLLAGPENTTQVEEYTRELHQTKYRVFGYNEYNFKVSYAGSKFCYRYWADGGAESDWRFTENGERV